MRYIITIVALLAVISGLAAIKYKQISSLISMGHAMQKAGPPPEAVGTAVARADSWQITFDAVGNVAAARGVTVSNDAPGIVSAIHFESGKVVREGDILVELDTNVERSQLAALEARRDLAQINAQRTQSLVATHSVARTQQDTDDSVVKTSRSDLDALRAQIARKVVRAPFSGKLGIRLVNLGQYLTSGTPIASLESTDAVFVDFSLPQQRLASVALGMPVRVVVDGNDLAASDGAIDAIDPSVDSVTRSIKLRASVPNGSKGLLPGMFARVSVLLPDKVDVVMVPAPAVVHAAFGDSLFIVENRADDEGHPLKAADGSPAKVARQQFVKLGDARGDFVAVANGLAVGQEVVTAGAFKLHNGSPIVIDNTVEAKAEIRPHPENR
jgi:membrane fusion protein (multidrug efflux system)